MSRPRSPLGAFTQITRIANSISSYFLISSTPARISAAPSTDSHAQLGTHSRISTIPRQIRQYPAI